MRSSNTTDLGVDEVFVGIDWAPGTTNSARSTPPDSGNRKSG
jgi:hypothetical protein